MSPRTQKQYKEIRKEKKEHIVSAALSLFAKQGYHATSVSKIASEAGISKGLMYNYFNSKEQLLEELLKRYFEVLGSILQPQCDDEITTTEMSLFFDNLLLSLNRDNEYWKLYSQLSLQPEVLEYLLKQVSANSQYLKHQHLINKYFEDRFVNSQVEAFCFTSLLKGFTIQYVFAPEMFCDTMVSDFINKMKAMYVIEKKQFKY